MSHKKNSKRKQKIKELASEYQGKKIEIKKALELLKEAPATNFDQSVEIALQLGIDTKKADQQVRGTASLPSGSGKKIKVAVIAQGDSAKAAKQAGADIVGAEDLLEEISKGNLDFDKLVATSDMMKDLGKLGRILGPKGLMPNPKDGTVVSPDKLAEAVEKVVKGVQVNFRAEKQGQVVHILAGKMSFSVEDLLTNIREILQTIHRCKPSSAKGTYFVSSFVKSTMGPAFEFDSLKAMQAA